MNKVTVSFIPCEPTPALGYNLLWRLAGSNDAYTDAGYFASTPAVFFDDTNPDGSDYEGVIRSDCGDSGNPHFGNPILWTTVTESGVQNFTINAAYNFSIHDATGTGVPSLPPTGVNGSVHGHHTGVTGLINLTLSGSLIFTTKLVLFINGVLSDCVAVTGAGPYNLGPLTTVEGDTILISLNTGTC